MLTEQNIFNAKGAAGISSVGITTQHNAQDELGKQVCNNQMKMLLTAYSGSQSSKLLLQVLLVILLMVPISASRPALKGSEQPVCSCSLTVVPLQGTAALQKCVLCMGLSAYRREVSVLASADSFV